MSIGRMISFRFLAAWVVGSLVTSALAATMSASPNAPAITGYDIANYGTVTGNEKWWAENSAAGAVKGQTFTTGNAPALLKAVTYQVTASQKAEPTKVYRIRVGTVTGANFTEIAREEATQTFTWNGGEYMTWRFATNVLLAANTTYGVDVGMLSSTSSWTTGIPYLNVTGNLYPGGVRYSSGTYGIGDSNLTLVASSDRIFHLDMEHPLRPSPEVGASVPAGDVTLSWTNYPPTTGTDVWVDVWFGTDSNALTQVVSAGLNVTNVTVSVPVGGTYYWRVDSYLDGAPGGAPLLGALFYFVIVDSDGDGMPDAYELANTTPPSATALTPDGDDDADGLTNLQEYQLGTRANLADTDGDGLSDGNEVSFYNTSPIKVDTDNDGLRDTDEIFVYHTNPLLPDTEGDGLGDGDEITLHQTDPLLADTDDDGAGDWYEVTASYTSPIHALSRPPVPYPLPKPDGSPGTTNKPVKVFILSGQSNMVGMGNVTGSDGAGAPLPGTLHTIAKVEGKFPHLLDTNGNWSVRQDVFYRGVITAIGNTNLMVGQGADSGKIGPELGFGHVMGWYYDEPVLVIKTSQGNRGLFWDILPPGSPAFTNAGTIYAGYGQSPNSWPTNGAPSPYGWYAGKQYDDFFLAENDMGPTIGWTNGVVYPSGCQLRHNGVTYISRTNHTASAVTEPGTGGTSTNFWNIYSVFNVTDVLDNFATHYPQWAAQGFEIAGFAWFQGHWDSQSALYASRYETNLVNLIKTVRQYYEGRYPGRIQPNAPFVIATIGFDGAAMSGNYLTVWNAQLAVTNTVKYPEFAGNVKSKDTRGYWRSSAVSPTATGYHYNHNAETFMLVGDALGRGMIELLNGGPAGDYDTWAAQFPGADLTDPEADYDGDGMTNNAERLFGLDPTRSASHQPVTFTTSQFTYTRRTPSLTGYHYTVWTSTNMVTWTQDTGAVQMPGTPVANVETVLVTLSPALLEGPQLFVRIRAAP